jgi:hypothetical protein
MEEALRASDSLCWAPPSLTLPHKGGGNGEIEVRG